MCLLPVTKGNRKLFAVLTALTAIGLLACAVYLYLSVRELTLTLTCAFNRLDKLREGTSSIASSALAQLPSGFINVMRQLVPYLDFLSMAPAVCSALFLLGASAFGYGFGAPQSTGPQSLVCAKCFVWLSEVALLITLVFYAAVAILALFSDRPVITSQWDAATAVCADALPQLRVAVSDAQAALASLPAAATPGQRLTLQSAVDAARGQLGDFEALCECLGKVPAQVVLLQGAGLAGLAATLLALTSVTLLCCNAGCLRTPPGARVAPAPVDEKEMGSPIDPDDELIAN